MINAVAVIVIGNYFYFFFTSPIQILSISQDQLELFFIHKAFFFLSSQTSRELCPKFSWSLMSEVNAWLPLIFNIVLVLH